MAFSQEVANASKAPANAAPSAKKAGDKTKIEAFKAHGAVMRTDDIKAAEGSKRDKVAFVCALGNPRSRQDRSDHNVTIESYKVVGYKFKLLEDMTVPNAPLKKGYKSLVDVDLVGEVPQKAGDIVTLNLAETAIFLSRVEFAGVITGEGDTISMDATIANDREEPLPNLKRPGGGSVKVNMELIGDRISGEGKSAVYKVKEEFADKFSVIFERASAGSKGNKKTKKAGESAANLAAAFREHYEKKFGVR